MTDQTLQKQMRCPTLAELPPPPPGKTGWPWTEECVRFPDLRPDGTPWPRISIVTPSYNQGQYIEETIRSILLQGYPDIEYMIMDGGSTDESIEVISRYDPWLSHWESERDRGQAHAINKGLNIATGEWFQFINSDDVLLTGTLARVGNSSACIDAWCARVIEFDGSGNEFIVSNHGISAHSLLVGRRRTDQCSWHQPGVFMRRKILNEVGGFPESLVYTFDLVATVNYFESVKKVEETDHIATAFRIHSSSKTSTLNTIYQIESAKAREILAASLKGKTLRSIAADAAFEWNFRRIVSRASLQDGLLKYSNSNLKLAAKRPSLYAKLLIERIKYPITKDG